MNNGIDMSEYENDDAETLFALGRCEEALSAWEREEKVSPHGFQQCYQKGIALLKLDRFEEAASALETAIKLDAGNADARRTYAWVCCHLNRNTEAVLT